MSKIYNLFGGLFMLVLFACSGGKGKMMQASDLNFQKPDKLSVFYFLSPECPLCENYTKDIKDFYREFSADSVEFYGVFPGKDFPEERIMRYFKEYDLPIIPVLDVDFEMTQYFKAEITPECVLVSSTGEILYQGKFDNWLLALGRRKRTVDQFYLKDAIKATLANKEILVKKTAPIGCFIEFKNSH